MKKTFEFEDDKSSKFWTIETDDCELTVTYGKIGTEGQSKTKEFDDEEECETEAEKLIREKLKKGYVEQELDDDDDDDDDDDEEEWGDGEDGDDTDEEMDRIYELASENDKHIPEFIEVHREKGNHGFSQVEQIIDVLSSTDNGLRLLAFCCVYGVDNQALESCLPEWVRQYVGKNNDRREKLFAYMLLETHKTGKKSYSATFIAEALQASGVECDRDALGKILDNINENQLPSLASITTD